VATSYRWGLKSDCRSILHMIFRHHINQFNGIWKAVGSTVFHEPSKRLETTTGNAAGLDRGYASFDMTTNACPPPPADRMSMLTVSYHRVDISLPLTANVIAQ
jgi:hypothetical protein